MMRVPVRVRESPIHGLGVFAVAPVPAGTVVWALTPDIDVVIAPERFDVLTRSPGPEGDFLARYAYFDRARGAYVLCADDARFMNHAAHPNVGETVADRCVALRDITAGEELTCDYDRLDPRPMRFDPVNAVLGAEDATAGAASLRPARPEDRAEVLALFADHLGTLGASPDPQLDRDMDGFPAGYAAPGEAFVVAIAGGEIVAMGGLKDREIRRLYVRPSHRARGLARRIVEHLARLGLGARPDLAVHAIVAAGNVAARQTFAGCGFRPTGRTPPHPAMQHCEVFERRAEGDAC